MSTNFQFCICIGISLGFASKPECRWKEARQRDSYKAKYGQLTVQFRGMHPHFFLVVLYGCGIECTGYFVRCRDCKKRQYVMSVCARSISLFHDDGSVAVLSLIHSFTNTLV